MWFVLLIPRMERVTLSAPFNGRRLLSNESLVESQEARKGGLSSNKFPGRGPRSVEPPLQSQDKDPTIRKPTALVMAPLGNTGLALPRLPTVPVPNVRRRIFKRPSLHIPVGTLEPVINLRQLKKVGEQVGRRHGEHTLSRNTEVGTEWKTGSGVGELANAKKSLRPRTALESPTAARRRAQSETIADPFTIRREGCVSLGLSQGLKSGSVLAHTLSSMRPRSTVVDGLVCSSLRQQEQPEGVFASECGGIMGYGATATTNALFSSSNSPNKITDETSGMCMSDSFSGGSSSGDGSDIEDLDDEGNSRPHSCFGDRIVISVSSGNNRGGRYFTHESKIRDISRRVAYNNFLDEEDIPVVSTRSLVRRPNGTRVTMKEGIKEDGIPSTTQ